MKTEIIIQSVNTFKVALNLLKYSLYSTPSNLQTIQIKCNLYKIYYYLYIYARKIRLHLKTSLQWDFHCSVYTEIRTFPQSHYQSTILVQHSYYLKIFFVQFLALACAQLANVYTERVLSIYFTIISLNFSFQVIYVKVLSKSS